MNNDSKITADFLTAIQKYADRQKQHIENEVSEFKDSELKKAEDESLEEAYEIIQKEIVQKRTLIKTELARKEQESRTGLFKLRMQMVDSIFNEAKEKLIKVTYTDDYKEMLLKSAKKLSDIFGDLPCTLNVKKDDMKFAKEITSIFLSAPQITADASIKIGGIKGNCPELCIIANETLDTLLDAQRDWFISHTTLKVV